ncbi:SPOR domain-containing protein [Streptomyces sp. TS71-3]|uniref:SPOR domain-containing protein n=1 Tax=Streptomyces sp. TS71-3 TaxID=2733862 RepID=UPI001AFDCB88|nr:SPOR domain-containing protein [Streptomyces sp. TS71-3]GHJ35739.1 hypothetical protein Sm713_13480 [Streptomyces sp. TS71-3]
MGDSTTPLVWHVIRRDDNGNRYRIGSFPTKAEAQRMVDRLDGQGSKQLYTVERVGWNGSS